MSIFYMIMSSTRGHGGMQGIHELLTTLLIYNGSSTAVVQVGLEEEEEEEGENGMERTRGKKEVRERSIECAINAMSIVIIHITCPNNETIS